MSEVKRYDQSEDSYGNSRGMKWSPYGDYVLASDYDQLKAENERLRNSLSEVTTRIARDQRTQKATDSTLDGYLAAGISAADAERDTLRTQLAEIEPALVAKNHEAHDLEIDNRQLRTQLAEARELLTRYRKETPIGYQPHMIAHIADAWLEAE